LEEFSPRGGEVGWQEARASYAEVLNAELSFYASKNSWLEDLAERGDSHAFRGGDEHVNFRVSEKETRIYKITHSDQFGCCVKFDYFDEGLTGRHFIAKGNEDPWFYLKRWWLLNTLFDYETRLEAIVPPAREGWLPRICVSQPYVEGGNSSERDLDKAFERYGYIKVSDGAYYSPAYGVLMSDAFPRNVRIHEGVPVPFDVIASHPSHEAGTWIFREFLNKL